MSDPHPGRIGGLRLSVTGRSDVGCVRTNNEDSYGSFSGPDPDQGHLLVVADGMGGAAGGEVASRLAVETLQEAYFSATRTARLCTTLGSAMRRANQVIHQRSVDEPSLTGMGTTCTAAVVAGDQLEIAHVGDSRAYLVRSGRLEQLTHDHSLAAELERCCEPGQVVPAAGRHVLTRCLGVAPEVAVDLTEAPLALQADDWLLLCSDGLHGVISDQEILSCLDGLAPDDACQRLVDLALERGGPDNVTVQIAWLHRP